MIFLMDGLIQSQKENPENSKQTNTSLNKPPVESSHIDTFDFIHPGFLGKACSQNIMIEVNKILLFRALEN